MTLRIKIENLKANPARHIIVRRSGDTALNDVTLNPGDTAEFWLWSGEDLIVSEPAEQPVSASSEG